MNKFIRYNGTIFSSSLFLSVVHVGEVAWSNVVGICPVAVPILPRKGSLSSLTRIGLTLLLC